MQISLIFKCFYTPKNYFFTMGIHDIISFVATATTLQKFYDLNNTKVEKPFVLNFKFNFCSFDFCFFFHLVSFETLFWSRSVSLRRSPLLKFLLQIRISFGFLVYSVGPIRWRDLSLGELQCALDRFSRLSHFYIKREAFVFNN